MSHFFGTDFLETRRSSASLEPLIELLACPEPELWRKKRFAQKSKNCGKSMSLPLAACATGDNSPGALLQ